MLLEYRIPLLDMGTFTCAYIGNGRIVLGGCAVNGFSVAVVIPKICFKFGIGDKAYIKPQGTPVVILKVDANSRETFYTVSSGGMVSELPESALCTLSELFDKQAAGQISAIEKQIEKIINMPTLPDPLPGKKATKVTDNSTILANAEFLKEKFLKQIEKLANLPDTDDPESGKQSISIETNIPDFTAEKEKLQANVKALLNMPTITDPEEGKQSIVVNTPVDLSEIEKAKKEFLSNVKQLEDIPDVADPEEGQKCVPDVQTISPEEYIRLKNELQKEIDRITDQPILPLPEMGKKAILIDDFGPDIDDLLAEKELLQKEIDRLNDIIDDDDGGLIIPGQDKHEFTMTGGIRTGGCAYYVPPEGTCPC